MSGCLQYEGVLLMQCMTPEGELTSVNEPLRLKILPLTG